MQRRADRSVSWRSTWLILVVTAVVAGALLAGDVWYARGAALVAFVGGLSASLLAWREAERRRRAHDLAAAADLRLAGEKLHDERLQHIRLLQVLQSRNGELRSRLTLARAENAELSQSLATLRGDNVALHLEVSRLNEAHSAEILALPRRVSGPVSDREEVLWAEGDAPTVVDLKAVIAPIGVRAEQRHA
jgi:hypothetical protein